MLNDDVKDRIESSDVILLGIGEEFNIDDAEKKISAYQSLFELIKNKNYFVISLNKDNEDLENIFGEKYTVCPMNDISDEKWNAYLKWLSCTLNHRLLVMELGVSLNNPNVIRWPFERCVMINNSAVICRVNATLPQLPEQLSDKGISIKENSVDFCVL